MFRKGTNPNDVQMSDVLCDFCQRPWSLEIGMIEGHQGHHICGRCVSVAYAAIATTLEKTSGVHCTMCLEDRFDEPGWSSPVREQASICRRCVRMAAGALENDPDSDFQRPSI